MFKHGGTELISVSLVNLIYTKRSKQCFDRQKKPLSYRKNRAAHEYSC